MATPIVLQPWELAERGKPFVPISPVPGIYTHVGDSRWYGARRDGAVPRLIVVHTTESPDATVPGSLRFDARRPSKVSATAFVGEDGIGYSVPEDCRPWTQSRWNDVSLSIETIGTFRWSSSHWQQERPRTLAGIERLLADWSARWGIPLRWLAPHEILAGEAGVCDHLAANEAAILELPARRGRPGYTHVDAGRGLTDLVRQMIVRLTETAPTTQTHRSPAMYRIDYRRSDHATNDWVRVSLGPSRLTWIRAQASHVVDRLDPPGTDVDRVELVELMRSLGTEGPSPWDTSQPGAARHDAELHGIWEACRR